MKKWMALLMAAVMLLCFTGCGEDKKDKDKRPSASVANSDLDLRQLETWIRWVSDLTSESFSADSWAVLDDALRVARQARYAKTQAAVDTALKNLQDAVYALQSADGTPVVLTPPTVATVGKTSSAPSSTQKTTTTSRGDTSGTTATTTNKTSATTDGKDPAENSELSVEEAIALGLSKDDNEYTTNRYYVTGIIREMVGGVWGSMTLQDEKGNILHILSAYSADGKANLSELNLQPKVGDRIKLYGLIGRDNKTGHKACMYKAWVIEINGKKPVVTTTRPTGTSQSSASQTGTSSTTGCEHVYKGAVIKQPTCTEYGETKHVCQLCGYQYIEKTMPIDHSFSGKCGSKCSTCDERLQHKWNGGVVLEAAICNKQGRVLYTCTVCGTEHEDRSQHDAGNSNPVDIRKKPCVESGEAWYKCQDCGELFLKDVPPVGYHIDHNEDGQCDGCGA